MLDSLKWPECTSEEVMHACLRVPRIESKSSDDFFGRRHSLRRHQWEVMSQGRELLSWLRFVGQRHLDWLELERVPMLDHSCWVNAHLPEDLPLIDGRVPDHLCVRAGEFKFSDLGFRRLKHLAVALNHRWVQPVVRACDALHRRVIEVGPAHP